MTDAERWGRRITDPRALRALTHPGRNAILEHLQIEGPATATRCARVTGLSPSACSYHLRLLAELGFVAEATAGADGRERLWQATTTGWRSDLDDLEGDPVEARAADAAASRQLQAVALRAEQVWLGTVATEDPDWRRASLASNSVLRLDSEELTALTDEILGVLRPYLASRRSATQAPPGARIVDSFIRLLPRPVPPVLPLVDRED